MFIAKTNSWESAFGGPTEGQTNGQMEQTQERKGKEVDKLSERRGRGEAR